MKLTSKSATLIAPVALIFALTATPAVAASSPKSGIVAAYTLVVPSSTAKSHLQARAVIPNGISCPRVKMTYSSGKKSEAAMTMRVPGATTGPAFAALRACQANLPSGLSYASVGAIDVPAKFQSKFDKIAVFGDTGCRVTAKQVQDCNTPAAWPLARNAQSVAAAKPDVIFFTGDFFYREAACPADKLAFCGASPAPAIPPAAGQKFAPISDTDDGWVADTLIPMAPAFAAAPILVTRGNHESCFRGGNGWMMMFEIKLKADSCAPTAAGASAPNNIAPTYSVDFPIASGRKLRAIMVDSNAGSNSGITPAWQALQKPAYEQANKLASTQKGIEPWLITHRPMFGIDDVNQFDKPDPSATPPDPGELNWTSIDQTGAALGLTSRFNLMLASHVHVAQVVQMPGQPAQVIFGNGGSVPDSTNPADYATPAYGPLNTPAGQPIDPAYPPINQLPSYVWTKIQYGHAIFTPSAKTGQWSISQRDTGGKQFAACTAVGKKFTCK